MPLKEVFLDLSSRHSENSERINQFWDKLERVYSGNTRYYHTLDHLSSMYNWLAEVSDVYVNTDAVLFALFYHDFVYNTWRSDNEEQSAKKAVEYLALLEAGQELATRVSELILATKKHEVTGDNEIDTFTDIDLSILGAEPSVYEAYTRDIRREYALIPEIIYKAGRKKVLNHFLTKDPIYKTSYFKAKFEVNARENISRELGLLS